MKPLRLLVADDHDIVLQGLRRVLDQPGLNIVGTVGDGRSLVKAAKELAPDIIITDITMPLLNGLDAARKIRKADPKAKIIFLTMHPDVGYATEALSLGNCAYVLKSSAAEELDDAIRALNRGEIYITPRIADVVLENLQRRKSGRAQTELSGREREILQLIAEGRTFKEIASLLKISARTVEFHRNRIADKTGQRTMAALTRYAVHIGVISEEQPRQGRRPTGTNGRS